MFLNLLNILGEPNVLKSTEPFRENQMFPNPLKSLEGRKCPNIPNLTSISNEIVLKKTVNTLADNPTTGHLNLQFQITF